MLRRACHVLGALPQDLRSHCPWVVSFLLPETKHAAGAKVAGSSWLKGDVKTYGTADVSNLGHLCALASVPLIKIEGQWFSEPTKLAETRSAKHTFYVL